MAQRRTELRKIREILRLYHELNYSDREIGQVFKISHTTIGKLRRAVRDAGYSWPLPDEVDDATLEQICYPQRSHSVCDREQPDWNAVWKQMQRKGMTLRLQWFRYKDKHPEGYQYTQFCEHYNRWCRKKKVSLHKGYRAGVVTEVDYAGSTLPLIDPATGEVKQVPVFVAALGASGLLYAEATLTMKLEDWIGSHIRMFEFYGGATEIITPDNTKTGVQRACRYDPDIQRSYENMARHYGAVVMPTRVRKPRDKSRVERGVQEVLRWIIAVLRDREFFSLDEMNSAIFKELDKINDKPFTGRDGSRRSVFEELDKPLLKPLPTERFAFESWKKVKVSIDYHVFIDYNKYSVPYELCGSELTARITSTTVELFNGNRRIASHMRLPDGRGAYSTCDEHMPEKHARHQKMTPEKIMRWAGRVGEQATELAGAILRRKQHPAQGYRAILGIMNLGTKYGEDRLERACGLALRMNSLRYRDLKEILRTESDRNLFDELEREDKPILHKNIRGKEFYSKKGADEC